MICLARIRLLIVATLLVCGTVAVPAFAQKLGPDGAPNPTASVTPQRDLLMQAPRIEGRIDIPDRKASVLIQPAGRTWDYFHEVLLHWGAAVVILGTIVLLAAAYLIMGRLRISEGRSGRTVIRFRAFERFSHWLTAVSFVVLGLTGLNITFGKILLLPVIGPEAFSEISQVAKYVHNFTSFSFVAGLVLIIAIFFRDNLPREGRHRMAEAGWRVHQVEACSRRPLQSGREGGLLAFTGRGPCSFHIRLCAAVSVLRNQHCRDATGAGDACRRRRAVHRLDPRPHLHRHARNGGGI